MASDRRSTIRGLARDAACVAGGVLLSMAAVLSSPSAPHTIGSDGRVAPAPRSGLGYDDAVFLANFRRPIAEPELLCRADRIATLRERLLADFEADRALLEPRMPDAGERALLLAYLTLRVNGSVPAFDPTAAIQDDLETCLLPSSGNCATLAMRLLVLLELFDFDAKLVHWWSPAMEGHVFVDAFDADERRAYFLDPTANLVAAVDAADDGFLETLEPRTPEQRREMIEAGLTVFPHCFSLIENAALDLDEWSQLNRLRVVDSAVSGLTFGLPIVSRRWTRGELQPPAGLDEMGALYPNLLHALVASSPVDAGQAGDP